MIITGQKALKLVSNHSVVTAVPELLPAVEAYVQAAKQYSPKRKCANCDRASFFNPVETQALNTIAALQPDAAARLKKFLGQQELYVNLPQAGKVAILKQL
jgi:hypothetical protein